MPKKLFVTLAALSSRICSAAGPNAKNLLMSAALVVVGVSLVTILMITAVVTRVGRRRVFRQREVTPQEQYRREIPDRRPRHQTSLGGRGDAADAPRPVLGPDDLAALVRGAVQNAPERELVGDHRRLRRAKSRRKVWAAGTAEAMGANYGGDGGVLEGRRLGPRRRRLVRRRRWRRRLWR